MVKGTPQLLLVVLLLSMIVGGAFAQDDFIDLRVAQDSRFNLEKKNDPPSHVVLAYSRYMAGGKWILPDAWYWHLAQYHEGHIGLGYRFGKVFNTSLYALGAISFTSDPFTKNSNYFQPGLYFTNESENGLFGAMYGVVYLPWSGDEGLKQVFIDPLEAHCVIANGESVRLSAGVYSYLWFVEGGNKYTKVGPSVQLRLNGIGNFCLAYLFDFDKVEGTWYESNQVQVRFYRYLKLF